VHGFDTTDFNEAIIHYYQSKKDVVIGKA